MELHLWSSVLYLSPYAQQASESLGKSNKRENKAIANSMINLWPPGATH